MAQTPPTSVITHFYYRLSRTVLRSSDDPACTCRASQWHLRVILRWFRRPLNQSQNHKSYTFIINSHQAVHAQSTKWPRLWCDRSAGWFISIVHLCLSDATRDQVMDVWWVGEMCVCDTVNCLHRVNFPQIWRRRLKQSQINNYQMLPPLSV